MRNSSSTGDRPVLSKTAEYALRALLVLARHGEGRSLPAEAISGLTGTPANYLGKTLNLLARHGVVRSTRGPSGGFALAIDPSTLTIAEIVDVFSEAAEHPRCLLGTGTCDASRPCAAHDRWRRVISAAREPLRTTTIADLLADSDVPAWTQTTETPHLSGTAGSL